MYRSHDPEVHVPPGQHQCDRCSQSFPSARGLYNHRTWHQTQDAAARSAGSTRPAPAGPAPQVPPLGDRAETPLLDALPQATLSPGPPSVPSPTGQASVSPLGSSTRGATSPAHDTGTPQSQPSPSQSPSTSPEPATDDGADPDEADDPPGTPPVEDPILDMPPDHTDLLGDQARLLRQLLREPPSQDSWDRCEAAWAQAVTLASEAVRLPPLTTERPRRPLNPANAADIQRLYRRNRRRAVRLILEGPSRPCEIPLQDLEDHWGSTWSERTADTSLLFRRPTAPEPVDLSPFAPDEVLLRLRKSENTAPGTDRLTYHHWKAVDPEARFLTALFNACVHHRRTPDAWRTSRTVLIYKKGDSNIPSNWRPIALGCTASKLYAKCLAARLQTWALQHQVLSHCQKGFLPYDGVFELNYVFQHRLGAARGGGPDLCAALLDFTNAYGSVPHQALFDALRGAGAGDVFTDLITDLYAGNRTCLVAAEGTSQPVPILAGLRQGCPLSGLLFNLVIDPIVRDVQGEDDGHNILAYADDLTPLATSPVLLQSRIDRIEALATSLGLSLNPAKCSSLHLSGATPVGMRPTSFLVSGTAISALRDFQPQRFLGRPVGYRLPTSTGSVIDTAIDQARKIFASMLAPWQRLDAVRTFVYPALNFPMRCGVLTKTDWRRLDDAIRPLVKRTLYLPGNASNNYVYGSAAGGAAGIPVAAELSDICRVDSAYKLLTTTDRGLRDMALLDAYSVASARLGWEATRAELESYLSGNIEDVFRAPASQLRSVWTEARKASRRLQVYWTLDPEDVRITCGDTTITPTHRCRVMRSLREVLAADRDRALHDQPNQGKVLACVAADRASSHFMRTGAYTHFADWRFIHKARLNLHPLNGARMWGQADRDQRCRICGYARETLPHVVCHCMAHSATYTARHNAVVDRLRTAASARFTVAFANRPVGDTNLRPDLVLVSGEEAIVIDVACPFENTPDALTNTRNEKVAKYEPVAAYLRRRYQRVTVAAIVVGALGATVTRW
ncbi:uncharacterized protein LOC119391454 [Rhipicephalus sanguineus]|uniref:uncharacterized protein LOC119391454 n=1 Tax=Rhipicephalus sanguineus TaxID=34632 RepID=UPI001894B6B8|nr:uncharacterized protein LOC119391454 [Rhipicephalus sanguineus]